MFVWEADDESGLARSLCLAKDVRTDGKRLWWAPDGMSAETSLNSPGSLFIDNYYDRLGGNLGTTNERFKRQAGPARGEDGGGIRFGIALERARVRAGPINQLFSGRAHDDDDQHHETYCTAQRTVVWLNDLCGHSQVATHSHTAHAYTRDTRY